MSHKNQCFFNLKSGDIIQQDFWLYKFVRFVVEDDPGWICDCYISPRLNRDYIDRLTLSTVRSQIWSVEYVSCNFWGIKINKIFKNNGR